MFPRIERVYVNERAHTELGWCSRYDFNYFIEHLKDRGDLKSALTQLVGSKGYHSETFSNDSYPIEWILLLSLITSM